MAYVWRQIFKFELIGAYPALLELSFMTRDVKRYNKTGTIICFNIIYLNLHYNKTKCEGRVRNHAWPRYFERDDMNCITFVYKNDVLGRQL